MFEAHFQSFDDDTEHAASGPRVAALRTELARRGLTGFIVPRSDRHQNEYVPSCEQRLAWLTGFTGSAGVAIVLMHRAVLFVDGRYTLQVRNQVDTSIFTIEHLIETPPDRWIGENLTADDRLGYDPWLHTIEAVERLEKACAAVGAKLIAVEPDLIDAIWTDRPAPPLGAVKLHDLRFAGEATAEKLARIRAELAKQRADALVVSDPHAVAWTFTIRGAKVSRGACPIALMKAVKNAVEIAGARAAHVRDGAAVTRFLAWFDREAPRGKLTEIDAVAALESFRRDTGLLKDISFPTIAAAGPDGAIVHYRVTTKSNRLIAPGELFLIDSGAQYEDGTTDITRTVAIGEPTGEMRDRFTRVLKGHIAIARAVFPEGTTGAQID